MKSFEEQFYLENPTRFQVFTRDILLLIWLLKRALMWLGKGFMEGYAYEKEKKMGQALVNEEVINE